MAERSITLHDAVQTLALVLTGYADHDADLLLAFCETFKYKPLAIWRELLRRVPLPPNGTVH